MLRKERIGKKMLYKLKNEYLLMGLPGQAGSAGLPQLGSHGEGYPGPAQFPDRSHFLNIKD